MSAAKAARVCFSGTRTIKACENYWYGKMKHSSTQCEHGVEDPEAPVRANETVKRPTSPGWTVIKEGRILRKAMGEEGMSIAKAARTYFAGSRTLIACNSRWHGKLKAAKDEKTRVVKKQKEVKAVSSTALKRNKLRGSVSNHDDVAADNPAWQQEEDNLIVERFGRGFFWNDIADELMHRNPRSGRTQQDVSERYETVLHPSLKACRKSSIENRSRAARQGMEPEESVEEPIVTGQDSVERFDSTNNVGDNSHTVMALDPSKYSLDAYFSTPVVRHPEPFELEHYDI
jgi:hypothetical protein